MADDDQCFGGRKPANDNGAADGRDVANGVDPRERVDAVVLNIARLIGRRMAREDFEKAARAANDNAAPARDGIGQDADDED